jgi:hypothetical protein
MGRVTRLNTWGLSVIIMTPLVISAVHLLLHASRHDTREQEGRNSSLVFFYYVQSDKIKFTRSLEAYLVQCSDTERLN